MKKTLINLTGLAFFSIGGFSPIRMGINARRLNSKLLNHMKPLVLSLLFLLFGVCSVYGQQWNSKEVSVVQPSASVKLSMSYRMYATVGGQVFTCKIRNLTQKKIAVSMDMLAFTVCGGEVSKHIDMELDPGTAEGGGSILSDDYAGFVNSTDCEGVKFKYYSQDLNMEVEGTNRIRSMGYRNFTLKIIPENISVDKSSNNANNVSANSPPATSGNQRTGSSTANSTKKPATTQQGGNNNTPAAKPTISDIYSQSQTQRNKEWDAKDDRRILIGMYADYLMDVGANSHGNSLFVGAINFGLKVNVPLFASGDGTNMGDTTGDLTFSAGYNDWISSPTGTYSDLTSFSGLVGFRLGLSDMFFIESQAGYSYGMLKDGSFKIPSSNVSGIVYDAHIGITLLKGLDIYGLIQSGKTKVFGSPIGYGGGFSIQF